MDDNSKYIGAYSDLLTQIAENVEQVYFAGAKGEYDRFWDAYQDYGNRKDYGFAFARYNWTDEIFKPKYDIVPNTYGAQMFHSNRGITNLKQLLIDAGVRLDLSKCDSLLQMFQGSTITHLPLIDGSAANSYSYTFGGCTKLISIDKFISSEKAFYSGTFSDCKNLESVIFEGVIAGSGFNVSACVKLTHESLMSIINCLKDYSGTGETYTCTLGATNLAKLTDAEKAIATEKGWTLA